MSDPRELRGGEMGNLVMPVELRDFRTRSKTVTQRSENEPVGSFDLTIEAGRAERHYWRDLWRYRELFYFLGVYEPPKVGPVDLLNCTLCNREQFSSYRIDFTRCGSGRAIPEYDRSLTEAPSLLDGRRDCMLGLPAIF